MVYKPTYNWGAPSCLEVSYMQWIGHWDPTGLHYSHFCMELVVPISFLGDTGRHPPTSPFLAVSAGEFWQHQRRRNEKEEGQPCHGEEEVPQGVVRVVNA